MRDPTVLSLYTIDVNKSQYSPNKQACYITSFQGHVVNDMFIQSFVKIGPLLRKV
jgi:hypothetical protein